MCMCVCVCVYLCICKFLTCRQIIQKFCTVVVSENCTILNSPLVHRLSPAHWDISHTPGPVIKTTPSCTWWNVHTHTHTHVYAGRENIHIHNNNIIYKCNCNHVGAILNRKILIKLQKLTMCIVRKTIIYRQESPRSFLFIYPLFTSESRKKKQISIDQRRIS